MTGSLRFAIVGCGKIAPRHAAEMVKHGHLLAVCDTVADRAVALAGQYGCRAYADFPEMLAKEKQLDLVAVCTPNGLHASQSIAALHAGLHVLCEKPLSLSLADARAMIEASRIASRQLLVVKSTRYNPALLALKEQLDQGRLGKLYSFQLNCFWNRPPAYYEGSWRGDAALDGGTLYTQFSHYIDALLWLLGDMEKVNGFRRNLAHGSSIDFEDSGIAALQMESGVIGGINWSVNSFGKNMEVSLSLLAEHASIRIDGEYMNRVGYERCDGFSLGWPAPGQPNDYGFYQGSMSNHDKIYENLVGVLQGGSAPIASAWDGLKTVETIEAIYQTIRLS